MEEAASAWWRTSIVWREFPGEYIEVEAWRTCSKKKRSDQELAEDDYLKMGKWCEPAPRLIRIDPNATQRLLDGFKDWVKLQIKEHGSNTQVKEADEEGHADMVSLKTPWGEGRNIIVAFLPGRGFGGGQGVLQESLLVKVFFDDQLHWGSLLEAAILRHLDNLLKHELTHALDWMNGAAQKAKSGDVTRLDELGVSPERYFNDPSEIRAYMRSIYEEITPYIQQWLTGPMVHKWGFAKILTLALQQSPSWKMMNPHLTPTNRNRILKNLTAELQVNSPAKPCEPAPSGSVANKRHKHKWEDTGRSVRIGKTKLKEYVVHRCSICRKERYLDPNTGRVYNPR